MEQVQIINYFPNDLERQAKEACKKYENDPRIIKFRKKEKILQTLHLILWLIALAAFLAAMAIPLLPISTHYILIPIAIFAGDVLISTFIIPPLSGRIVRKCQKILSSYMPPAVLYHNWVNKRPILACYGRPCNDKKFELTVTVDASKDIDAIEDIMTDTFLFDYDDSRTDGILTLDVSRSLIFYT